MSKSTGPILAVGLTIIIVALVAVFSFLPGDVPASTAAETVDVAQTSTFIAQEATYQEQIDQLGQLAQNRQAIYQTQQEELATRLVQGRERLLEITALEQTLQKQIEQISAVRVERQMVYEGQIQEVNSQYEVRYAQLQAQLDDTFGRLAEANAQLGR